MILFTEDVFAPNDDDARRWAENELADPRYAEAKPTWFDLAARDFGRFITNLFTGDGGADIGPSALVVVSIIIVAALIIALVIWGRPRRGHTVRRASSDLLGARDDRTAAQLRAEAERSARNGDWDEATVLRFRALAKDLLERDLIDPAPGATAQRIANEVTVVFRSENDAVRRAATSFDDVRYLRHPASAASYAEIAATDDRLRTTRPETVPA